MNKILKTTSLLFLASIIAVHAVEKIQLQTNRVEKPYVLNSDHVRR